MNAEWRTYKLEELCEFINGFAFKSTDYVDPSNATYEVLRMGYINRGGGYKEDSTPVFVPRAYGKNLDKYVLKYGDIAIAMTDMKNNVAILGNTARIIHKNRFVLNQRVGCIRVKDREKLCPIFLYYYSNWSPHIDYLRARANSGVQVNLSTGAIKESTLQLPPLETQQKIGKVLLDFDDKIDLNCRINQTLEAMAQAIFKSWFVDFDPVKAKIAAIEKGEDPLRAAMRAISGKTDAELDQIPREHHDQLATTAALFPDAMEESELGEIPKGWEISDFGSVSVCFDKNRIPLSKRQREDKKGNIPYYGATSVMDYVGEHIFDGVFLLLGEDGSVLREDGTPFVQYIWGKSWVNNHAHVLQGANGVSTEQLMLFISMQNISAYVTGAVQLKLNQKNMNSIPFVKATKDINAMFSRLIAPLYAKYRSMVEEIHSLTEYRDTLLPKLLSGEISVETLMNEVAQ
ncbi:restriction endonuclease subunit S [Methylobacillus sp.]|uniref:restriction endonuclease subunit S n=1 Tax=Methylobacillus sp. TaxID=56818 RepID=UPI002FE20613